MAVPAPIHVGIDATTWSNDRGFGRFTREFVTALARRSSGFRYTLVFDRPPRLPVPEGVASLVVATALGLDETAVGSSSRSPAYLWQMGRAVRQADFDLFFFPAVYSYFPLIARTPCVVCYHDATAERLPHLLFPTWRNRLLWTLKTRLAIWQTTRAMTVSQASARDLHTILGFPENRIDVVTEAADALFRPVTDPARLAAARARHGIPAGAETLVYVGGMNAHKNIFGLLRALPAVVAARPATHLVIVGDTSGKGFWDNVPELRAFVASNPPLPDHVHFTGYIPDGELVDLFGSAAALVFPSLWEGFGLPAVEAMACGLPVLASNRSSLPEVVGEAGLFFDPENQAEIADCLLRFLGDPALQAGLRAAAIPRAGRFTWDRAAELGEASFARAAAMHRKRPRSQTVS